MNGKVEATKDGSKAAKGDAPKAERQQKAEDDLSHIHPSRRGLMGKGAGGRAKASDFM